MVALNSFNLNLLVVLDVLLREKNVTRAAEQLKLSQPAMSSSLSKLRKTLNDPLLVRQGREMRLSPRANELIGPVREVLGLIERSILQSIDFDPANDGRRFAIVCSEYVSMLLARPLLGRLRALAPHVRLDLSPVTTRLHEQMLHDEVDVAVIPEGMLNDDLHVDCRTSLVLEDRYVGAVWSGHEAAAGGILDEDVLARWPYLMYQPGGGRSLWDNALDQQGVRRRVEVTASALTAIPFLLAGTELVTIGPERLLNRVAGAADIAILQSEISLPILREFSVWSAKRTDDPGIVWLRGQLQQVASQS